MKKKPRKKLRSVVKFAIFKKTAGIRFPGDFWEEHTSESKSRRRIRGFYDLDDFRLVKVTYDELE